MEHIQVHSCDASCDDRATHQCFKFTVLINAVTSISGSLPGHWITAAINDAMKFANFVSWARSSVTQEVHEVPP